MLQTVRAEKVDEKNGVICLASIFLPELWSLTCPKNFLLFCVDLSNKPKSVKAIYMHTIYITHFQNIYGL